ncbi:hypothetical protein [Streptomyces sp. NPDC048385]|uniref:hypothetical protein n=1 Tax=Streptomyces sp. NPDC048385 TaxID=3155145 RepID=UPI00342C0984
MPGAEAAQPSAADISKPPCTCVIAHVQNGEERAHVQAGLDHALKNNDAHAVLVACLQLMQPCPARDELVAR